MIHVYVVHVKHVLMQRPLFLCVHICEKHLRLNVGVCWAKPFGICFIPLKCSHHVQIISPWLSMICLVCLSLLCACQWVIDVLCGARRVIGKQLSRPRPSLILHVCPFQQHSLLTGTNERIVAPLPLNFK